MVDRGTLGCPMSTSTLLDLHGTFAWVLVGINAAAGVWALAAHWLERLRGKPLWIFTGVAWATIVLQVVLGEFSLLPIAVGEASPDAVAEVLDRLWGGHETLIVVSSDMSHYLPYEDAHQIDAEQAWPAAAQSVLALMFLDKLAADVDRRRETLEQGS